MVNQNKNTTNQILADSIKALVLTKPVEKITIKEITDKAGVIRPTFYNHFQDKYELLEWVICTEILEPAHPLIRNGLTNQAVLLRCIQNVLVEIFLEYPRQKNGKFPWMSVDMLAEHYARSMCYAVKVWIRQGMTIPAQEMADTYEYLMSHSMEQAIREF